jgi:hypothetical protein
MMSVQEMSGQKMVGCASLEMLAAGAAHEANRLYCLHLGDTSQLPWIGAPAWQRKSALEGVRGVMRGNTPEQSHETWLAEKWQAGWTYGPVKDAEKKEHPCMVPYEELPAEQRLKDHLFVAVVKAVLATFGEP